jgi:hypothetical protein
MARGRAQALEAQHAAIRLVTQRACRNEMAHARALALIAAVLQGDAIAELKPGLKPGTSRIQITAAPNAHPEVRALLEQAQLPAIDGAERVMLERVAGAK